MVVFKIKTGERADALLNKASAQHAGRLFIKNYAILNC